jgi:hypothetical protein
MELKKFITIFVRCPPFVPILSHINPLYVRPLYFCKPVSLLF